MKIISLSITIFLCLVIFSFSNQTGIQSSNTSNLVITKIIVLIKPNINKEELANIKSSSSIIIRKIAHYIIYLILTISVIYTLNTFNIKNIKKYAFLLTLLYAIFDELHQTFIPLRSGNIIDILIDTLGIITALIVYKTFKNKNNQRI